MKTIEIINLKLTAINNDLASFKCENTINGIIHTKPLGKTTIMFDGGYVLGHYPCPHVAIDELTKIHIKLTDAEKESGTYAEYKKNMVSAVFH